MKEITIFTDGSCKGPAGNKRAGYGVYFPNHKKYNISSKLKKGNITNQVVELTACVKGIERVLCKIVFYKIIIYTDSMYLINSVTCWAEKWKENKWRKSDGEPVLNKKIIKKLYYYYKNLNIEFHHVKAHKKEPENKHTEEYKLWYGNHMADKLANEGADSNFI
jgi:ribonuclease HI